MSKAIPEELKDIYQFPTDPVILQSFHKAISPSEGWTKYFSSDLKHGWGVVLSSAVLVQSYVYSQQPMGDVARMIKYEKMNPIRRGAIRALPAVAILSLIYNTRQMLIW